MIEQRLESMYAWLLKDQQDEVSRMVNTLETISDLPDLANKNKRQSIQFEFQINNKKI